MIKTIGLLVAILLLFTAACKKQDGFKPGPGEDRYVVRMGRIYCVDENGNNLIGTGMKYHESDIRIKEPLVDSNWFLTDWSDGEGGLKMRFIYFFSLVHKEDDYLNARYDYVSYISFNGIDIDTLEVEKHSKEEIKFFWNGDLKGMIGARDTVPYELKIVK